MKIGIVNDLSMAVEAMRRVILSAHEHQVAWVAGDGAEAVARCATDTPDLVLMDLIMPKLDGVEATRQIMANTPCAIVVVTASVDDNSSQVFEAMGAGALDAVNTPVLEHPGATEGARELLAKIDTIRKLIGKSPKRAASSLGDLPRISGRRQGTLLAMGASAGGPAALAKVLGALPADLPAACVIIQHVDVQFVRGLAEWLAEQTCLRVRLADEGDEPKSGEVLLAGRDHHLACAASGRLSYTQHPIESSYRPSVDVFFKTAARYWPGEIIGVLLTGMGRDGAEGLSALHRRGHHTIAQDRATSAVYGMPKAAAELNAATEILALDRIGPRLVEILTSKLNAHA